VERNSQPRISTRPVRNRLGAPPSTSIATRTSSSASYGARSASRRSRTGTSTTGGAEDSRAAEGRGGWRGAARSTASSSGVGATRTSSGGGSHRRFGDRSPKAGRRGEYFRSFQRTIPLSKSEEGCPREAALFGGSCCSLNSCFQKPILQLDVVGAVRSKHFFCMAGEYESSGSAGELGESG